MKSARLPWCLLLLALLVGVLPAPADIAPDPLITGGGTPMARTQSPAAGFVRMVWEEVDLYPSPTRNRVEAVFGLRNEAKETVRFEVGFPSYFDSAIHDFQVEIDGKACAAERKTDAPPADEQKQIFTYWMCWPMEFAPGQEVKVKVAYWCETGRVFKNLHLGKLPADLLDGLWHRESGYVLRTGAGWGGSIGLATLRLHYSPEVPKERLIFAREPFDEDEEPEEPDEESEPRAIWTYDAAANVDTLVLKDFEPDESSDILYTFAPLTLKQEAELLEQAIREKRLDPWAMEYLLRLVEKKNVYGLSADALPARVQEILEYMLPPKGPKFHAVAEGQNENDELLAVAAGAEDYLRQTFQRVLPLLQAQKRDADAKAVRAAYRDLLRPIVLRERESLKQHPEWKNRRPGQELAATEAEWANLGGDAGE